LIAAIVDPAFTGTDARIEIEGDSYTPATVTLLPRDGGPTRVESTYEGRGLRHQADGESPLMPLDESVAIMRTMDAVQAQALR
jgi:hypothetical protein